MDTRLTPTEQRLYEALADGLPHLPDDLARVLYTGDKEVLAQHISNLRKKIAHLGEIIVCEFATRRKWYRLCQRLASSRE